jgi:hypothetical protein
VVHLLGRSGSCVVCWCVACDVRDTCSIHIFHALLTHVTHYAACTECNLHTSTACTRTSRVTHVCTTQPPGGPKRHTTDMHPARWCHLTHAGQVLIVRKPRLVCNLAKHAGIPKIGGGHTSSPGPRTFGCKRALTFCIQQIISGSLIRYNTNIGLTYKI